MNRTASIAACAVRRGGGGGGLPHAAANSAAQAAMEAVRFISRPSRSPCAALPPCEPPHPPDRSAEGAKRGGRRALVACSYANAYLISAASVHGRPTNESPTGSPRTCPMGTVTWG